MTDIETHSLSTEGFASKSQVGDFTLDLDDDLSAVRFDIHVEADLSDEEFADITERAEDICHVHAALREELHADVSVHGGAEIQH